MQVCISIVEEKNLEHIRDDDNVQKVIGMKNEPYLRSLNRIEEKILLQLHLDKRQGK